MPAVVTAALVMELALDYAIAEAITTALTYAVAMFASAVVAKAFLNPNQPDSSGYGSGSSPNPGNRQQIAPNTSNKLPVVYGSAYVGGTIVDMSISDDNQQLYYVLALSEVTNSNSGQTPDTITFGDIYYGGKKVIFNSNGYSVDSLYDESTMVYDTTVAGKFEIFLYSNGYNSNVNSPYSAQNVMSRSGLIYTWDTTKLMSNCCFAIIHLSYSQTANIRGIEQTRFQVINSRTNTGDCIYDYLINTRYGAALPLSQINTASLADLTTYSNQSMTYTTYAGLTATLPRFKFDGTIDTSRSIMDNLQDMSSCCDCLIKYNEITAQWGVIVNQPTYTVVMDINDSNMISAISVSPIDLAGSYNVVEAKFANKTNQDSFDAATFDLAEIDPTLLYPNEPVNKVSISLPLVNNDVRAQYIATRLLKSAREDLQLQVSVSFIGIQLEAGDVVTVTNVNYGWVAKLFRINKVIQQFNDDGSIVCQLTLMEFNPTVYDDYNVTQFTPAPNTGIGDPTFFGTVPAPVVTNTYPTVTNPSFSVAVTTSSSGITQYAEVWYSAYSNPLASQMYFAGTSEIQSNGTPWSVNTVLPTISLTNVPAGDWYIFSRMVNSLASSSYSSPSTLLKWRPSTFQYSDRYLAVVYGDDINGTNLSLNPSGKLYYGLRNQTNTTISTTASYYTWYIAQPAFGTNVYLAYANRTGRKFSFATGFADYAAGTAAFVPTDALTFDPSLWSALPTGSNYIDLDMRTGQVLQTGTTTVGTGELALANNPDGKVVASLKQFLDFGTGVYQKTQSASLITVDIYGRVVGFEAPDSFYYTDVDFTATAGQTVFSVTRGTGYIVGQCWVFKNGLLLDTTEYTDATSTVTLGTGATVGDIISIVSFKSYSNLTLNTATTSGTGSTATITFAARSTPPFTVGQSITVSGVTPTGYNGTYTVTACTTSSVSYASTTTGSQTVAGTITLANRYYASFSRNTASLSSASSYTASGFTLYSGYELLFLNGTIMNDQDYDIIGQTITNFPSVATGDLQIIQWTPNNLGLPNGNPVNTVFNTVNGQANYSFSYDSSAFNLYENGVSLKQGTDFTTATGGYTLTPTPTSNTNVLVNQTFARTGAV